MTSQNVAMLEARAFAQEMSSLYISFDICTYYKRASALITARDAEIRAEALNDAADRAVVYAMTRTAIWPEELREHILGGVVRK
jgi:hypothetical protein